VSFCKQNVSVLWISILKVIKRLHSLKPPDTFHPQPASLVFLLSVNMLHGIQDPHLLPWLPP
jgi:hypothetical protein